VFGSNGAAGRTLAWLDRSGKLEPLRAMAGAYRGPRLAPDGQRVAFSLRTEGKTDVAVLDRGREVITRVTFGPGDNFAPVWAPDGKHIAFASNRDGRWRTYWARSDGLGDALPITGRDHPIYPSSF